MRKYLSYLLFAAFMLCSCTSQKEYACKPGFILVAYIGEVTSIRYAVLIRTDEQDSSYLDYVGVEQEDAKEKHLKNGFRIDKYVLDGYYGYTDIKTRFIVDGKTFLLLKDYIVANHTHADVREDYDPDDHNAQIVILSDKCDTIKYIVTKSDSLYFRNLIDLIKGLDNEELDKSITYLKGTQGVR
jgi:hypothetical protein